MKCHKSIALIVCAAVVSQASNPRPTADQLLFQYMEMGALVCYNMATINGTQGCPAHTVPPASLFDQVAPETVNTDQWCNAIASFGGKYATIVAKHVCGFAIWPSKATLPARNFTYDYKVADGRDIIQSFAASCASVGVKLGIYYSVVSNEYLNVQNGIVRNESTLAPGQQRVSQDEYNDIVKQQLQELWTQYGDLAEIWFDGGFKVPGLEADLLNLLNETQPHASVFNGCGLSRNAVAWIGTESGHAPYPVWNNQDGCPAGAGSPNGSSYVPKEVDLTLQNSDTWFYREGTGYRSLEEMVSIYHDSVGHGGNMLLNIAPPPNSTLPAEAMKEYARLGTFIRECYGEGSEASETALAATTAPCDECDKITLSLKTPAAIDRVIIKEELSQGQLVRAFTILVDNTVVFNGTAIGRTLIARFQQNVTGSKVELHIQHAAASPTIRLFAIPDPASCLVSDPRPRSCHYTPGTRFKGPVIKSSLVGSPAECCSACGSVPSCACFVAAPTNTREQYTCDLLNAQTGTESAPDVTSGTAG